MWGSLLGSVEKNFHYWHIQKLKICMCIAGKSQSCHLHVSHSLWVLIGGLDLLGRLTTTSISSSQEGEEQDKVKERCNRTVGKGKKGRGNQ